MVLELKNWKMIRGIGRESTPQVVRNEAEALPETGETDNVPTASLFGTLFAVLGSIFLFWRRRKEEDEEQ
ncbi:LPXTG cell wall anchor domain-containing protein [Staphylococcus carnosus]|uniref:Gram-positive cocci surface proteins LPxTG domain-containing protein n=1 Tax=Staphylococcus carnosus TaxID=1281 RepID=A0AAJ0JQ31_STACA|nr:LPXTG cell wall anchor domain-containing protein [Staphylococcus carnosus]ANZ32519.1 hypothetical protein BEK99_01050 [Staphylococcus carnosus]KKB25877.1 hypothetical protein VV61_04765 [Staphylococcus carnosus]KOR13027.1 hypothetical protein AMC75_07140 [Staphylococcus carnosus]PNZ96892.1 hypothetical protein CD153_12425 [Staphylococcus carnosus]QPT04978.1 LPXTG cell wall anchor domain-containing protein [Staphylococcus carnosus]